MSEAMRNLLNQYSGEGEGGDTSLIDPEGNCLSMSDMAVDAISDHGRETVVDMVEHAEKAEEIAEGLSELAEKAEELADEDHTYMEQSLEGMQREFNLLMRLGDLGYKATIFASEMTPVGRAKGLAKDCRRIAMSAQSYRDGILDYSPEGAIMQTLGFDKYRMDSSVAALARLIQLFEKEKLPASGVIFSFESFYNVMQRGNLRKIDVRAEFEQDRNYLAGVSDYLSKYLNSLESGLESGHVPAFDENKLVTKPNGLLGNREVTAGLKYNNNAKMSTHSIARVAGGAAQMGTFGWIFLGPVGAAAAATVAGGVSYLNNKNIGAYPTHSTVPDIIKVAKRLIELRSLNKTINELDKGKANLLLKRVKAENPELYKQGQAELAKLTKAISIVYDHSKFLITSLGGLINSAMSAADQIEKKGEMVETV